MLWLGQSLHQHQHSETGQCSFQKVHIKNFSKLWELFRVTGERSHDEYTELSRRDEGKTDFLSLDCLLVTSWLRFEARFNSQYKDIEMVCKNCIYSRVFDSANYWESVFDRWMICYQKVEQVLGQSQLQSSWYWEQLGLWWKSWVGKEGHAHLLHNFAIAADRQIFKDVVRIWHLMPVLEELQ